MSASPETVEVLRGAPLLRAFGDADLRALCTLLEPRTLDAGDILFRQGSLGDDMVIVASGALVVLRELEGEAPVEFATVRPGEVVGEMACLDPAARSATVSALEPTSLYTLDRRALDTMRANTPSLMAAFLDGVTRALTARLRAVDTRIQRAAAPVAAPAPEGALSLAGRRPYHSPLHLASLKGFETYTAQELERLEWLGSRCALSAGTLLCREGDPGDSCFILARGRVDVIKRVSRGTRHVATLDSGAIVGQMSLVDQVPRSASVIAREEVLCLILTREAFRRALAEGEPLAIKLLGQVAVAGVRQLRLANGHLASLEQQARAADRVSPEEIPFGQAGEVGASDSGAAASDGSDASRAQLEAALGEWSVPLADVS